MATIKGKYKFVDKPTKPAESIYIENLTPPPTVYVGDILYYGFAVYAGVFIPEIDTTEGIYVWEYSAAGTKMYDFETETWTDEKYKIVDFTEETDLTGGNLEWFTANLMPYDPTPTDTVTIEYNNTVIASLKAGQSASLPCKDKPMLTDVVVSVPESMSAGEVVEEWDGSIEVV